MRRSLSSSWVVVRGLWLLGVLALCLTGQAITVAQRGNQVLIDGQPVGLTFARGCDDPESVPAYRALGFNTLLVKVDSPGSVVITRVQALIDAAQQNNLYVLLELAPGSWLMNVRVDPENARYRDRVAYFLKGVAPKLQHSPNLIGWILSTTDESQLFAGAGAFSTYLQHKYLTVERLNTAWTIKTPDNRLIQPRISTFAGLTETTAVGRAGGDPEVAKKVYVDLIDYRKALAEIDAAFQTYLRQHYASIDDVNRQWGFRFPSWEKVQLQTVVAREKQLPGSSPLSTLELARYQTVTSRNLVDWWARQVHDLDGAHLIFAGAENSYRTLSLLPASVNGALTECYPGVAESDTESHNPQAFDIARHGNRFIVLAGISAQTKDATLFANYLYEAALHGAGGIGVQAWAQLTASAPHAQAVKYALADIERRRLLNRVPTAHTAIVYSPFLPGFTTFGARGLYGYLPGNLFLGPSALLFTLRQGSCYGQLDLLAPDDLPRVALDQYGVILLPSVLDLPEASQEALRQYVEGGGIALADLGLGTLQATGDNYSLPLRMSQLFGVTTVPAIVDVHLNLEVYREHPRFPSLLQGMRTTGLDNGYQITRAAQAVPSMGTDLLFQAVTGRPGIIHPTPRPYKPLDAHPMRGVFIRPVGQGFALYTPVPLYAWWAPGCMLFEEWHRDLLSRGAEVMLQQPFDFIPARAEIAAYEDGSVAVWTKDRFIPVAQVHNPQRRIYLTAGGRCRIGPDGTELSFTTPGYHLVEPLTAFVYPVDFTVSVTATQATAKGLVLELDADNAHAAQPVRLRLGTSQYAIAPHSKHQVTLITPDGGTVEPVSADENGWLNLTIPHARGQVTITADIPTIEIDHPATNNNPRDVDIDVVPALPEKF